MLGVLRVNDDLCASPESAIGYIDARIAIDCDILINLHGTTKRYVGKSSMHPQNYTERSITIAPTKQTSSSLTTIVVQFRK